MTGHKDAISILKGLRSQGKYVPKFMIDLLVARGSSGIGALKSFIVALEQRNKKFMEERQVKEMQAKALNHVNGQMLYDALRQSACWQPWLPAIQFTGVTDYCMLVVNSMTKDAFTSAMLQIACLTKQEFDS